MNKLIIIPSRLASTRLKDKPLADINGRTMICRVCEQAEKSDFKSIVAAGDQEILQEIEKSGYAGVMTDKDLNSGTDRIYQALEKYEDKTGEFFNIIINLQGDLPVFDPKIINDCVEFLESNPEYDITTLVSKFPDKEDADNPNDVKVAIAWDDKAKTKGKALYFSRAKIPYNSEEYFHHIGIYVYRKEALEKFVKLEESELEKTEKLEQLRALESNMNIGVCLADSHPIGVDTQEDLEKVRNILSNG
jgi:3-deoxy-manno-octulosonate cytidylyltransferase (CMP-KDO synthetase)